MSVEELLSELRRLDRADKLRAMQVLAAELAADDGGALAPGAEYEVWSPHDSADAARVLSRLLEIEGPERTDRGA